MIFEDHWSRFRTISLIFFRTTGHMSMYLTLTSRSFLWKERTAQHWLQLLVQFGALFCMMRERQCIDYESLDQMCLKDLATFAWEETMHWLWVNVMKASKRPYTVRCLLGRFQWVPSHHLNSTWLACLVGSNGTAHQLNFIWLALFGVTTLKQGQTILKMLPLFGAYDSSSTQLMSLQA